MDIEKLRNWAKRMGFQGEITDSFKSLLPATTMIWAQVIDHVKPKEEIKHIRNNIISKQVEAKKCRIPNSRIASFLEYQLEQVDLWEKRNNLQKKLAEEKAKLNDKNRQFKRLQTDYYISLTQIEYLDANLYESETKSYLLRKKEKSQLKDIESAKAKLEIISNIVYSLDKSKRILKNESKLKQDVQNIIDNISQHNCDEVNMEIRELYVNYPCNDIWEMMRSNAEITKAELQRIINAFDSLDKQEINECAALCENNLLDMHMLIIENELEVRRFNKKCAHLQTELDQLKIESIMHLEKLYFDKSQEEISRLIESGLEVTKKRITSEVYMKIIDKISQEMAAERRMHANEITKSNQLRRTLESLELRVRKLLALWENYIPEEKQMNEQRYLAEQYLSRFRTSSNQLKPLIKSLRENVFTKELEVFLQMNITEGNAKDKFPYNGSEDDALLTSVVSSLGYPIISVLNLTEYYTKLQLWYNKLQSLKPVNMDCNINAFDLATLTESDSYLNNTLDEFSQYFSAIPTQEFTRTIKIWTEMPFGDYVPSHIKHNGKDFKYYADLYMHYYTQQL